MATDMGMRSTGWQEYLKSSDEKPELTWERVRRVISYARPHWIQITVMLLLILERPD